MYLNYSPPATSINFNLHTYDGFPQTIGISMNDVFGNNVYVQSGISVPDSNPVPISYSGSPVTSVLIFTDGTWSSIGPIIDDHGYLTDSLGISITGSCPGSMTLDVTGATSSGLVGLVYGTLGSFEVPHGPCAGMFLGISNPTFVGAFPADATGSLSLNYQVPAGLRGKWVQAVDVATCIPSLRLRIQ